MSSVYRIISHERLVPHGTVENCIIVLLRQNIKCIPGKQTTLKLTTTEVLQPPELRAMLEVL
jgi:hypothetical protein